MLDDLEVDHDVYRRVGQWQLGQVCLHHLHSGIAAPDMGHRSLVVVHRDDLASDAGDQVGAISSPQPASSTSRAVQRGASRW